MPVRKIKLSPPGWGGQKRPFTAEELKPKGPMPPKKVVDSTMEAIPAALLEIGEKTECSLVRALAKNGHPRFAAKWALFRHVEQGRIEVQLWFRHCRVNVPICDPDDGTPVAETVEEHDEKEYRLKATDRLWTWWRETGDAAAGEWLTVSQASRVFTIEPWTISRAATEGKFRTNKKTGRQRRIELTSFFEWASKRAPTDPSPSTIERRAERCRRFGKRDSS